MSGICGIVTFDGAPVEPKVLRNVANAAAHRGPDGIRYWYEGAAGLAHLALDLTPGAFREPQPTVDHRNGLVLTSDARIDNRTELVRALGDGGYLPSEAPTEADIILAAYRRWGEACPGHIIGDFAFAIWDKRRKNLFAARDPMGMRALYYRVEPRRVLFATEVKQILAAPDVQARLFEPAVAAFLASTTGLPEWTYYQGIAQLPPAHALSADAGGHRTWRYWDIDPNNEIRYAEEGQYAEHFAEIFKEAVRCRLRSSKPVGIFLSGGMDSGSVASTAGWLLREQVPRDNPDFRAYCWAFEQLTQADERHISDGIVGRYDIPVTYVEADTAWPLRNYPAHGPDQDDPYLPFFRALADRTLLKARTEGMGTMLTGGLGDLVVGADIFDYLDQMLGGHWATLWGDLRDHGRSWNWPRRNIVKRYMWEPFKADLRLRGAAIRPFPRRALGDHRPYPAWIRPEFAQRADLSGIVDRSVPRAPLGGFARRQRYQAIFSPDSTQDLIGWERSNARAGLGDADPFGDRRVVSFAVAVPQSVLCRAGEMKRLLRRAMVGIMPEEVRRTAGKIHPTPFLEAAVTQHARETVQDLATKPKAEAYGFIDGKAFADDLAAYMRGDHGQLRFWHTLALEMWLREYWA